MLDLTQPLEFDNGVPITDYVVEYSRIVVQQPHRYLRGSDRTSEHIYYSLDEGVFVGGDKQRHYYVQNVANNPEMYIPEDWS